MRRFLSLLIVLLALGLAPAAEAQSLDQAKAQGLVGERLDGYVGLVDAGAPAAVRQLVEQVNRQRRAEYERIARERGVALEVVAQLVGEQQIQRARSGTYVMGPDGRWRQK